MVTLAEPHSPARDSSRSFRQPISLASTWKH